MATEQELLDALMRADDAGDEESAAAFAAEIKRLRAVNAANPSAATIGMDPKYQALMAVDPAVAEPIIARNKEYRANVEGYENAPELAKPVIAAYDIGSNIADAATFGYGGKAAAYLRSNALGTDYDAELEEIRRKERAAEDRSGWAGTAAKVATGARMGIDASKAGLTLSSVIPAGRSLLGRLASAATIGTAEGAGYGALDAAGHDQGIAEGAATGALLGGGLNTIGEGVLSEGGALLSKIRGTNKAPTIDELRAQKDAAYKAMENSETAYKPEAFDEMMRKIKGDTIDSPTGARETRHPKTVDVVSQMDDLSPTPRANGTTVSGFTRALREGDKPKRAPVSLYDLDTQRKAVRRDLFGSDKSEQHFGEKIVDRMDEMIANTDPSKVTSKIGTPQEAVDQLLSARELNSRLAKTEQLATASRKAQRQMDSNDDQTGGNPIRQKVRQILDNDKKVLGFTPDEVESMEGIVSGTKAANRARRTGKLLNNHYGLTVGGAIGAGLGSMVLPGSIGAGLGAGAGMMGTRVIGNVAEAIAERSTEKSLQELIKDVARGRKAKPSRTEVPLDAKGRDELMRMLMLMSIQEDADRSAEK
jgi:hypothetical protein